MSDDCIGSTCGEGLAATFDVLKGLAVTAGLLAAPGPALAPSVPFVPEVERPGLQTVRICAVTDGGRTCRDEVVGFTREDDR